MLASWTCVHSSSTRRLAWLLLLHGVCSCQHHTMHDRNEVLYVRLAWCSYCTHLLRLLLFFVCTACGARNHFQVLSAHLLTFKCLSLAAILGKLTFGILGKKQKKNWSSNAQSKRKAWLTKLAALDVCADLDAEHEFELNQRQIPQEVTRCRTPCSISSGLLPWVALVRLSWSLKDLCIDDKYELTVFWIWIGFYVLFCGKLKFFLLFNRCCALVQCMTWQA